MESGPAVNSCSSSWATSNSLLFWGLELGLDVGRGGEVDLVRDWDWDRGKGKGEDGTLGHCAVC